MIDLWNALPGEARISLIVLGFFLASVLAGATRNAFDNALIDWLRRKWDESRASDDRQTQD